MCGIFYILSNISFNLDNNSIENIIEKIKYRGPDFTNIVRDKNDIFVHTLLAIQGHNPQPYKYNNNYLLFNGEIYGTSSLEESKVKGIIKYDNIPNNFKSESDFLIDYFYKNNFGKIDELDGEFVINYVDKDNNKLHIITDPFGTKPFCFFKHKNYFIASSYESCVVKAMRQLKLNGNIEFVIPNTHYIYDINNYNLISKSEIVKWDFNPIYSKFDRWNIAFDNSIKKRTNTDKGIFIPLSSGYDSGCIVSSMINQGKKFKTYTFKGHEDIKILEDRRKRILSSNNKFYYVNPAHNMEKVYDKYFKRIENYNGYHYDGKPYSDIYEAHSCFGIYQIFQQARTDNQIIFLSGHGGDEIFSDYGNQENIGASILELDYTNVRSKWPNFDSSYGRNIIQMFERIGGCFGIESRYPFLDKQVVQEFLWLNDNIKNKEFKQCIAQYMRKYNFPFLSNEKSRVRIISEEEGGKQRFIDYVKKIKLNNNYIDYEYPYFDYNKFNKKLYRPKSKFKPPINYNPLYRSNIYYKYIEKNYYCIHAYKINLTRFVLPIHIKITHSLKCQIYMICTNKLHNKVSIIKITNGNIVFNKYNKNSMYYIIIIRNNNLFYLGSNNQKISFEGIDKHNSFTIDDYCEIPLYIISYLKDNKLFNLPDEYNDILYYINEKIRIGCNVFFIAYKDSCNTCRRYMKAIESAGLNTIGLKSVKHPFNYPDEMKISKTLEDNYGCKILEQFPTIINIYKNIDMINGIIASVKYVHMHGHTYFLLDNKHYNFKSRKIKLIITVGGSVYRFQKNKCNNFFNKYIDYSISQCTDLYDFGLKNNKLIHYPLDTEYITPDYSFKDKHYIIVGHFPSTSIVKGSEKIIKAIHNIYNNNSDKFKYIGIPTELNDLNKFSNHRVSFDEQLQRYKKCDIYIETLNLEFLLNNKKYPEINQKEKFGEWGNTCLEACYSGCIVISNCLFYEKYKKSYGIYPGFIIANTQKELEDKLKELILKPRDELLELKKKCVKWVKDYHSIEKIGKKMYNEIYSNL